MQVLQPELARKYGNMSLGEYVHQQNYSQVFISNYLLPMCAAVWSVPNAQVTTGLQSCLLQAHPSIHPSIHPCTGGVPLSTVLYLPRIA